MSDPFHPERTGTLMPPWPKGVSGNPGGRPKLQRPPSRALAELNETTGESPEAIIEAFKAARGEKLCAADFKAIAMFRAECVSGGRNQVPALEAVTDRLEGKLAQRQDTTLKIEIVPYRFAVPELGDGKRGVPELLEAEVRRKALRGASLALAAERGIVGPQGAT